MNGRSPAAFATIAAPLILVTLVVGACTAPRRTETTLAACHNGIDDDERGGADCEDEQCARFCETSEASCSNGLDDDGDGLVDCLDPKCRGLLACATVDAPCDPWTGEGCSGGRACFETDPLAGSGSYCAVPGAASVTMGSPCEAHEDCPARFACAVHRCVRRCADHADCPRESACIREAGVGFCFLACVPLAGQDACSPGFCRPFTGVGFGGLPGLLFCDGAPLPGSLQEGAICEDVVGVTAPQQCISPTLCVAELGLPYGKGRCRPTCALDTRGAVTVPCVMPDRDCKAALPNDPREPLPGQPLLGLCMPRSAP